MPNGFDPSKIQNLPIPPGGPNWNGAANALLDEFQVPVSTTLLPLRGARIFSPDSVKPGVIAAAGCAPNCTLLQEFGTPFSRVAIYVKSLRSPKQNDPVPIISFQVNLALGGTSTQVFDGTFDPKIIGPYGDLLVQLSGLLATEMQFYGCINPDVEGNENANPLYVSLGVILDRAGANREVWPGPDVT